MDSLKHLHKLFKRSPKNKSNFFTVNLPRERSFQKIFFFSALTQRLLVFKYGICAQTVLSKIHSIQRIYCIVFDVILRRRDNDIVIYGTIFPESTFDFANA